MESLMDMEVERVLKRDRTKPEPEEVAEADAEFRQSKMPRHSVNNKFEVFISHRGPDTKQTLAYHIYDLLRCRGVEVFLDLEELQAGDSFPEAIKEAIECSRVHLCILSSRYTESVWCLKELEMMIHRYEIGASVIIPIFYDITPSDVRRLKGAIGQGIQKQTQRYSSQVVDQWINALRKIADITGHEGKGSIATTVVDNVCQQLHVGSLALTGKVVGIWNQLKSVKDDIMRRRKEGHSVTSVELTGIGGIGKTTFAKILYNQIHSQYMKFCFIEDVNGLVDKGGINAVHKQLISELFSYDPNLSGSRLKQLLKSRLQNAEILVVLDNINKEKCVSTLFLDDEDDVSLLATSTIIVTSREQGVLKHDPYITRYRKNLISLQISKLEFKESKELFCRYAFGRSKCLNIQYHDLMNKIINKCDGIPLALALFGKHVYGRDLAYWKSFWDSIEHSLSPDINKILRFSYDNLDSDLEKCLFLDVAIFFRRERVDLLRKFRAEQDENDGKVSVALDNLQRKHLIDIRCEYLQMHDLLVDLGRTIVESENCCPGSRSRLWHPSDVKKMLYEETGTDKVRGLSLVWQGSAVLDEDETGDQCAWSVDAFAGMSSLELLILDGYSIEGDLSKLSKRLLWLRWTDFPFERIPRTLCIKRLRVLDLQKGRMMTQLWEHSPNEAPSNLRQLNVQWCTNLQRLPEFNRKFRQLSSITLQGCEFLEFIPDSFGLLTGLKHLKFLYCPTLKRLSETTGMLQALQDLELRSCTALEQLPETIGDLQKLRSFWAESCYKLKSLPVSFGKLQQISTIYLQECQNLAIAENSFGQVTTLESINIIDCKLQKLPCQVAQQSHLKTLCFFNTSVPLQYSLSRMQVEELPLKMQNLSNLDAFELRNLVFTHLPQSMGNLTALTKLYLSECLNLQELPECVGRLSSLKRLTLQDCPSLQKLPLSMGNLSRLQELSVTGCHDLTELPESIGRLSTSLQHLILDDCWSLRELPEFIANLSNLEELSLCGCRNLQKLPASIQQDLTVLVVHECYASNSKGLPCAEGNLTMLTALKLANHWEMVEQSIHSPKKLPSLKHLYLSGCVNHKHCASSSSISSDSGPTHMVDMRRASLTKHQGCYKLPVADGLVRQLHKLNRISLSRSEQFLQCYAIDFDSEPEKFEELCQRYLVSKSGPWLKPRLLDPRTNTDNSAEQILGFEPCPHLAPVTGKVCFMGKTYTTLTSSNSTVAGDIIRLIPSPKYCWFLLQSKKGIHFFLWQEKTLVLCLQLRKRNELFGLKQFPVRDRPSLAQCGPIRLEADDDDDDKHLAEHTAVVQESYMNWKQDKKLSLGHIRNQWINPLYSQFGSPCFGHGLNLCEEWDKVLSQLHLFPFSALDIANCTITKAYLHYNTCLLEEETSLTWKRRQCLFYDDHALALLQKGIKFSYKAVPVFGCDLKTVANVSEMCISISSREKQRSKSRFLQKYIIDWKMETIPYRLYGRIH